MPELFLYRNEPNQVDTPGELLLDMEFVCHTIEDVDRNLTQSMPILELTQQKIYGKTAIPYGRYAFDWYDSPKHGRVPLLKDVPGFTMIEVHVANYASQLLGCVGVGMSATANAVWDSRKALNRLRRLIIENNLTHINILKK